MDPITIREYQNSDQPYFESFNRHWIEKHFWMEPLDEWVLTKPEEAILHPGGAILMAYYGGVPAGTVALRKVSEACYEFTKMAVADQFQRKGIAEALSRASFSKAAELGANKVILYSNSVLTPAISLYEKLGFRHVPMGTAAYKRSDVKMEIPAATALQFQPTGIKVMRAGPVEAEMVSMIGKTSFRAAFEHLFRDKRDLDQYLQYTYDIEKLRASMGKENNVYLLAYNPSGPAGFAKVKRHSLNEQLNSYNQSELQKIYVLPEFQGQHAGDALMQGVIRLSNEIKPEWIWLDTHIHNSKAIGFYQKTGFVKMGKHHFTIGSQSFTYDLMAMPVIVNEQTLIKQ